MYKCAECGKCLDELPTYREKIDGENYETIVCSDCCCGGEYEHAVRCCICGEITCESEISYDVCESCMDSIKERYYAFIRELTAKEQEAFFDWAEDGGIYDKDGD